MPTDTQNKNPQDMTRSELVAEVERLRTLAGQGSAGEAEQIVVRSGINLMGQPFVQFVWGEQQGSMTPDEALDHGLGIIEAANAADFDKAAFRALTTDEEDGGPGFSQFQAIQMILVFRRARQGAGGDPYVSSTSTAHFIDASAEVEED